jgi:hypothetical protein
MNTSVMLRAMLHRRYKWPKEIHSSDVTYFVQPFTAQRPYPEPTCPGQISIAKIPISECGLFPMVLSSTSSGRRYRAVMSSVSSL